MVGTEQHEEDSVWRTLSRLPKNKKREARTCRCLGKQDSEFEQELLTARGRVFRYRKLREEKEIRWQGRQGCDREIFVVDRGVFVVD